MDEGHVFDEVEGVRWMRDKCRRRGELDEGHVYEEKEEVRWIRDIWMRRR